MERGAQGAIEYLLIIGAAILVVAIVILAVTGVLSGGQSSTASSAQSVLQSYNELEANLLYQRAGLLAGQEITPSEEASLVSALGGLWHLNSDASSSAGSNFSSTVAGSPALQPCLWGTSCYHFPGNDASYVQITDSNPKPTKVTYSLWFRPQNNNSGILGFVAALSDGGSDPANGMHARGGAFLLADNNVYIVAGSYSGGCSQVWNYFNTPGKALQGQWNHLVFSIDYDMNMRIRAYLNGVNLGYMDYKLQSGAIFDGTCGNDNYYLWLGRRKAFVANSLLGDIDEFAYWSRIFSDQEAKNLFEKGAMGAQ